jgi:hypothetical protein
MRRPAAKSALVVVVFAFSFGLAAALLNWPVEWMSRILAGFAIVLGANTLFSLWLWFRAAPRSGDAIVAPTLAVLSATLFVPLLLKAFWPEAGTPHLVASLGSAAIVWTLVWRQWRQRRATLRPPA